VHRRHREAALAHLGREPVDLLPRVDKDDGLRDGERVVQVAQGVELPLLLLDGHEELLDALSLLLLLFAWFCGVLWCVVAVLESVCGFFGVG